MRAIGPGGDTHRSRLNSVVTGHSFAWQPAGRIELGLRIDHRVRVLSHELRKGDTWRMIKTLGAANCYTAALKCLSARRDSRRSSLSSDSAQGSGSGQGLTVAVVDASEPPIEGSALEPVSRLEQCRRK
jgi:hypothetical protein